MTPDCHPADEFIEAAGVPVDGPSHEDRTLERANAVLAAHPEVAEASIFAAAIAGHDEAVRRFLEADSGTATVKGGPRGWDALTYLCFSKYLRLDRTRADAFLRAATALLDAGANPNTGWFDTAHHPTPEWESAIYGAAAVARDAALTRLLLDRGADPNDDETPYHAPETYDNAAVRALVESGTLTADSMATLLLRKTDLHDREGIDYLLAHGADPNRHTRWGGATALHHALRRDNDLEIVKRLLDRGADPHERADEGTAVAIAAHRGRADVLRELARRGIPLGLEGVDALIAAAAVGDVSPGRARPEIVVELIARGSRVLGNFAGNGNTAGVARLLDFGVPVTATFGQRDGYWGLADRSTALHVAAWRASHDTVRLLIERGATVNARDAQNRTPLMLAVKACVDSYWTARRAPDSVSALLAAGASIDGVAYPSGYAEVDALLERHRQ